MPAAFWPLTLEQGEDFDLELTYSDDDGPIDLTGYTARMQVRETIDSPTPLAEFNTDGGGYVTIDGPPGKIFVSVPADTTSAWTWHYGVYSLEIYSPTGKKKRLLKGSFTMDREVVR